MLVEYLDRNDFESILNSDMCEAKGPALVINQLDEWFTVRCGDSVLRGFDYIRLGDLRNLPSQSS